MNPFGEVGSRQSTVGSPETGPVLSVKAPFSKEPALSERIDDASRTGGNEGGIVFEARRSNLKPEVRRYADRVYADIRAIYASYGAKNAADLYLKAKRGSVKVPKEDAKRLQRMLDELEFALKNDRLPEGHPETFPPYEYFMETVDRINDYLDSNQIVGLGSWEEYELIGGELNGRVVVGDPKIAVGNRILPILNGQLIEVVDGRGIVTCSDVQNIDGKLNCSVFAYARHLPVIAGELIKDINGKEIRYCSDVRNINGKLNGIVDFGDARWPVINGNVIEEIEGRKIIGCEDVRNVGGELNGVVNDGRLGLPVIAGKLVTEIDGRKIKYCHDVRNVDGKLNGRVSFDGEHFIPVISGELIETIDGKKIEDCAYVCNIDGKLNCTVWIDRFAKPVIAGLLILEIEGRKINRCMNVRNAGGKLSCKAEIDGRWLPVVAGELCETVEGVNISFSIGDANLGLSDAGGVFSGRVEVEKPDGTSKERTVVLGEFID